MAALPSDGHKLLTCTVIAFVPAVDELNCQHLLHPGPAPAPGAAPKKFWEIAAVYPVFELTNPHATTGLLQPE